MVWFKYVQGICGLWAELYVSRLLMLNKCLDSHGRIKKKHICALFQSWQSGHCPSFDAVLKILQACLNEDQTNGIFLQQDDSIRTLGEDGHFLFSSLDTDHDLYLSPEEFKPIAEKLTGMPLLLLPVPTLRTSPT